MSESIKVSRTAFAAVVLGLGAIGAAAFFALKPVSYQASPPARQIHLAELIGVKYPLGKTIEVLAEPEAGAPTITRIREGSEVMVLGVVEGDGCKQISLPDQQLGYVQVAAIPAAAAPSAQPAPPPVVAAAPPQMPPAAPAAPPPPADNAGPPTVQVPPVVEFEDAHEVRQVVNPTAVYLKPDRLAPVAYPVGPGRQVYVVARSKDGNWAWVETADNAPAYVPSSDIGP